MNDRPNARWNPNPHGDPVPVSKWEPLWAVLTVLVWASIFYGFVRGIL